MRRHLTIPILAAAPLALALWLGCESMGGGEAGDGAIAARIGDDVLTVAELDARIKEDLFARETRDGNSTRLYDLRSKAIKGVLADRVLEKEAKSRGLTPEELIEQEFPPVEVSREEIESFHRSNARLRGVDLDSVADDIRAFLQERSRRAAIERYVDERSEIVLERERVSVRPGGPSLGPDEAPVTIVEYSDFQCPYCQRASPVLKEIAQRHPQNVRVVYRHLPLDSLHPQARAGAEAAACAEEGGAFWAYHDVLFANNRALGPEDLKRYAEEVGLDAESFAECVESRRFADAVEADVEEAKAIGITGTPAFVVNGIVLFGLQSVDSLDAVVREELSRLGADS